MAGFKWPPRQRKVVEVTSHSQYDLGHCGQLQGIESALLRTDDNIGVVWNVGIGTDSFERTFLQNHWHSETLKSGQELSWIGTRSAKKSPVKFSDSSEHFYALKCVCHSRNNLRLKALDINLEQQSLFSQFLAGKDIVDAYRGTS
jgi:hypothetical protein